MASHLHRTETIVVTGGCGFIGQHIVRQLLEQKLFPLKEVRIFDIQEFKWFPGMEPYTNASKAEIKYIKGDICVRDELQSVCGEATTVIHSAALVDVTNQPDRERLELVNIKGTENVIKACIDNNIEQLVFTSSVDAFLTPDPFPRQHITEAEIPTPHKFLMGPYAASKFKGDEMIRKANNIILANGKKLKTCALRVPFTYGEGDIQACKYLEFAAKWKKFYPLGGTSDNKVQKMYAGNAAWAHVLAVYKLSDDSESSPAGKGIFIGDNTPLLPFSNHFIPFADRFGATIGTTIPYGVIYAAAAFIEILAWILKPVYCLRSEVNLATTAFFRSSYTVSWELSRRCLGYTPIFSYDHAMDRSWVYLRETLSGEK